MKRLVVCLDGTWNSADSGAGETNVARLARAVSASSLGEGTPQLTLYLRGVGSTGSAVQRLIDGMTGDGVDENIRSAYMFIAQNYVPGDGIYVFGFSRGAFTARSLCGFINSVGVLERWSLDRVPQAWRYYRERRNRSPQDFCQRHPGAKCHAPVTVEFLGVWDTVGALGVPGGIAELATRYEFHDTTPSSCVRTARHALAIDEHRDEFVPTLWTGDNPLGLDIRQVWFAGAHSDVGGGHSSGGLADIPLVWMAGEAKEAGLVLDWERVLPRPDGLNPLEPQHESRQGIFRKDVLTPAYRRICQVDCEVGPLGWLYVPSLRGRILPTIGESVHPSVWQRHGREVRIRDGNRWRGMHYLPRNLPPREALTDGGDRAARRRRRLEPAE